MLLVESQLVTILEHFRIKCTKLTYNTLWELPPIGLICFSQFSVSVSLRLSIVPDPNPFSVRLY